jgi:hypothetical protein
MLSPLKKQARALGMSVGAILLINVWAMGLVKNSVLEAAYAIPDGGGYSDIRLKDSGVHETIKHNGSIILPAGTTGSYCCGFTFEVMMKVAEQRGFLEGKSVAEIRKFQKGWYGVGEGFEERQCVAALEKLGIGREVKREAAKPGDFVIFYRNNKIGHSVVFLSWVRDVKGKIIGLNYRSSQPSTWGVADTCEFFGDSGMGPHKNAINQKRLYIGRLDRRWWSQVLYPLAG